MTDLTLRRVSNSSRSLRSGFRRARGYEVASADGERRTVSLRELDSVLDGRAVPADFWACVEAADAVFDAGDKDAFIEWPSGRRADRA